MQFKVVKNLEKPDPICAKRPYIPLLPDIINDRKTEGEWKIHSGNAITEHKTQGE